MPRTFPGIGATMNGAHTAHTQDKFTFPMTIKQRREAMFLLGSGLTEGTGGVPRPRNHLPLTLPLFLPPLPPDRFTWLTSLTLQHEPHFLWKAFCVNCTTN